MTRKTLIKTAELRRMAQLAKEFGVVVEQEFNGIKIRVAPDRSAEEPSDPDPRDTGLRAPPEPIQPPFDHREEFAMRRLIDLGVGEKVYSSTLRSFGPHTQQKLSDRGYIDICHQPGEKFKDDKISLTAKG